MVDDTSQIIQSYWLEHISRLFMSNPGINMFSSNQQVKDWRELCCNNYYWHIPLDQDEFDHNQSSNLIVAVIKIVSSIYLERNPGLDEEIRKEFVEIMDEVIERIRNCVVKCGNKDIPYKNGVLSGWRITAFIDAILSYIEVFCAFQRAKECISGLNEGNIFLRTQGDDVNLMCTDLDQSRFICGFVTSMGFSINKNKFFVDKECDEFLKVIYDRGIVQGYPGRVIKSICWINPESISSENSRVNRAREMVNNWNILISRIGNLKAAHMMIEDIGRFFKISYDDAQKWIFTPIPFGGAGLIDAEMDHIYGNYVKIEDVSSYETNYISSSNIGLWERFTTGELPVSKEGILKMKRKMFEHIIKRNTKKIKISYIARKFPINIKTINSISIDKFNVFPEIIRDKLKTIMPVLSIVFSEYDTQEIAKYLGIHTKASQSWFRLGIEEILAKKYSDLAPALNFLGVEGVFTGEYFNELYDMIIYSLIKEATPKTFALGIYKYRFSITDFAFSAARLDRMSVPVREIRF